MHMSLALYQTFCESSSQTQPKLVNHCIGTGDSVLEGASELQEEGTKKKRKSGSGNSLLAQAVEVGHHSELTGHTDAATSVIWMEPETLHSGSMDHSVSASSRH